LADKDAVYAISVAARMASMEIQNLRVYERHGLVSPARTAGGTRLYSADDVTRLIRIGELLAGGLRGSAAHDERSTTEPLSHSRRPAAGAGTPEVVTAHQGEPTGRLNLLRSKQPEVGWSLHSAHGTPVSGDVLQ
jgi:hypothetical protein